MPRVVSFIVLVAIVLLVAALFFQVMAQFILPLFLAGVLVVVFDPLHRWCLGKCGNRPRLSAGLTSLAILLIVLVPLCGLLWNAYREGIVVVENFKSNPSGEGDMADELWVQIRSRASGILKLLEDVGVGEEKLQELFYAGVEKLQDLALPLAVGGMKLVFRMAVGLAIMMLAVYYFFADGPAMVSTIMRLSPLDDKYELELLDEFGRISRAVVIATLLSAVVQGTLAGVGYYFAGVGPVFFLTGLTMLLAMVPFVGAAAVWVPTCAWLYLFGSAASGDPAATGSPTAAIVLAIYCATLVSASDNVVKPLVLHGQSNLHPLVALLSVLGGAQFLGPIGILVGPMVVAFLQALLDMLHAELALFGEPKEPAQLAASGRPSADSPDAPSPQADSGDASTPGPAKPVGDPAKPEKRKKRRTRRKRKRQ